MGVAQRESMDGYRELTCAEIVELVTDYLEYAMPAGERTLFEEHLVICDGCRGYLDQMQKTIELTGSLREEDLSPDARGALLETFRSWRSERG
jgi:predicted anti-sigma-YlaC factor YlaD